MERIAKAVADSSVTVEEISKLLYGDAAYEVVKALTDQQKKQRKDKVLQNVALGTNAVGSVAGPAALYSAIKHRREGGIPRDIASSAGPKLAGSKRPRLRKIGTKVNRAVGSLNAPSSGKARTAATAAGAGLIGLQAINWGGDVLSTKLINEQKKKNQGVAKSLVAKSLSATDVAAAPRPVRTAAMGSNVAFSAARQAPTAKARLVPKLKKVAANLDRHVKKSDDEMGITWRGEISKMDTDKRQVFGWASVIEVDGKPVVDLQDDILDIETIEKAAYNYVISSRKGGHQHARNGDEPVHVSDLVESFVITPEKREKMGLPDTVPTGWWVGFKVNDDEVWAKVKKGLLKDFSIHGSGVRKEIEVDD
jgi:hypothetical protein